MRVQTMPDNSQDPALLKVSPDNHPATKPEHDLMEWASSTCSSCLMNCSMVLLYQVYERHQYFVSGRILLE